jgi:cobyrinic acid a,c-diamide synthase
MIYLSQSLALLDGGSYAMAGVLPLEFEMTPRLIDFGYVDVTFIEDCLLGSKWTKVRGHSFHCSRVRAGSMTPAAYRLKYSLSGSEKLEGFSSANLLASYVHLHFRANPALAASLADAARQTQAEEAPV